MLFFDIISVQYTP